QRQRECGAKGWHVTRTARTGKTLGTGGNSVRLAPCADQAPTAEALERQAARSAAGHDGSWPSEIQALKKAWAGSLRSRPINPATSYSPTEFPLQYHRRWRA